MHARTLYLLRHAKAEKAEDHVDDRMRPLTSDGLADALRVGAYMRARRIVPALILCSPSLRTRQTAAAVEEALGRRVLTETDERLYLATPEALLSVLTCAPDEADPVMLVGHNPGLHQLSLALAGSAESSLRDSLSIRFPTAALAEILLAVPHWSDVSGRSGTLSRFAVPAGLEAATA